MTNSGLLSMILKMAVIFAGGAICTLLYIRLMVPVSQGVQKKIRDDMFTHMQKLPVRYFDQNATTAVRCNPHAIPTAMGRCNH